MPITPEEMARRSKAATEEELLKLHQAIAADPSLVERKPRDTLAGAKASTQASAKVSAKASLAQSDGADSSDSGSPVHEPQRKGTKHKHQSFASSLLEDNTDLHNRLAALSCKLGRCKSERDETEARYEHVRIENAELRLDLHEAKRKLVRAYRLLGCTFFTLTAVLTAVVFM